jgi:predicted nucleic acid-binding Zn ribbon protein
LLERTRRLRLNFNLDILGGAPLSVALGEIAYMAEDYTVILVNQFGQVLERDGSLHLTTSGHPHFDQHFSDLEAARRFCEQVVRELHHVECDVMRGKEMVLQQFDAEWTCRDHDHCHRLFAEQRPRDRRILTAIAGVAALVVVGVLIWLFR